MKIQRESIASWLFCYNEIVSEITKTAQPQEVEVNSNTVIGSQFAQVVGVSVSDTDVMLEFVFVNPQIKNHGQTVSRVTIPYKTAEDLSRIIIDTLKKHASKS